MAALGVCTNSPRCSKARSGEQVDFYPGFGEVCPECGRPLRKLPEAAAAGPATSAAAAAPVNEVNGGGRATVVPPPAAPPPEPAARPRRLITGHSPSEPQPQPDVPAPRAAPAPPPAPAPRPAAAIPIIAPIVPIKPAPAEEPAESAFAQELPAPQAAVAPPEPPPAVAPEEPPPLVAAAAPPRIAPAAPVEPAPEEPALEQPAAAIVPPPSGSRWVIPTPAPAPEDDYAEPVYNRRVQKRTIPRTYIFTGLGVALLAALGTFVYNLAGPLIGSRSTPAAAAFHVCGSRAIAGRLGVNLAKAFFAKLGSTNVSITPYGSNGLVVSGKVPGHWQTQSIAIDASDDSSVISAITGKVCQVGVIASATDNRGALANSGILGKIVGYDASVVVTNPSNPVSRLTLSQLAGVFSGAITNWSQVGGPNAPIAVFAPDQPGHYLAAFRRTVLNGSSLAASARVVNDPPAVSAAVVRDRDAIGFSGFIYADPGHVLEIGGADGFQPPTNSTIGQRHYPLTIPIYMYNTAQQTEPMVFDFIDFVRSDAGQTIVEDAGYVSRLSL